MNNKIAVALLVFVLLTVLLIGLVISGKLIVFDVCEERARDDIPKDQMAKMSPVTEEELRAFPQELKGGDMPSNYYHEVLKCRMEGRNSLYFRW